MKCTSRSSTAPTCRRRRARRKSDICRSSHGSGLCYDGPRRAASSRVIGSYSMDLNERMGRVLLLGATLALAWIGQRLLRAEPPRLLDGLVILALGAFAFVQLVAWSRAAEEPGRIGGWHALLQALAARAPQSFALLAGGVICGALAFWFEADPALLPWAALLAWAAGICLFLA